MNQIVVFEPDIKFNDLLVSIIDSCVRNFEVIPFYDSEDIVSYLESEYEDVKLLLVDYNQGSFNGVDILTGLKRKNISIPTILLSSLTLNKMKDYSAYQEIHVDNCLV